MSSGTGSGPRVEAAAPGPGLTELVPRELADRILRRALRHGGHFAELYCELRVSHGMSGDDGVVDRVTCGVQLGVGVRVEDGGVSALAFTEQVDPAGLSAAADAAGLAAAGAMVDQTLTVAPGGGAGTVPDIPTTVDLPYRASLLAAGAEAARARDPRIRSVSGFLGTIHQQVLIATSDGRYTVDERPRVRYRIQALARSASGRRTGVGTYAPGTTGSVLALPPAEIATRAADQSIVQLDSVPAPAATMPVVLGPGGGGVLIHEACGHGLEADAVRGRGSVFAGQLGTRVAGAAVTVVDDGRLPGGWGSAGRDDEGTPTAVTTLIEDGVLSGYLHDRRSGLAHRCRSTGNGRRGSFRHLPFPRMTNTYLRPGAHSPEEIIAATKFGLYAKSFSGGQANPSTGSFVFTVREAYLIRHGRLDRPVFGATLAGRAHEVLAGIDLVGDDLEVVAANCGREGQRVFVGVGQPTVRIGRMLVGGTR
jgi:TldD protein